jgi:hypothetical protein
MPNQHPGRKDQLARGLTVREVAARYRLGKTRILAMIRAGELRALDLSPIHSGRPRYVIMPDALAEFERGRQASTPPKPARRRRSGVKDYFPD